MHATSRIPHVFRVLLTPNTLQSIEDVKITNPELAKAMAQGAVARTNLIKAQIDQDVMKSQVSGRAGVQVLACVAPPPLPHCCSSRALD